MIESSPNAIEGGAFLQEIQVFHTPSEHELGEIENSSTRNCLKHVVQSGAPRVELSCQADAPAAVLAIPVWLKDELRSIVCFSTRARGASDESAVNQEPTGVFEVWEPHGEYQELGLTSGYYAQLERFENVSSFVRFEKGAGLPGQSWVSQKTVVHDRLPIHPGFLRAAGASAESLSTAIGIPVFKDRFLSTAVLINGSTTPLARAIEVWTPDGSALARSVFVRLEQPSDDAASEVPPGEWKDGLVQLALENAGAVLSDDRDLLDANYGNSHGEPLRGGLAIPVYCAGKLTCVTTFLI